MGSLVLCKYPIAKEPYYIEEISFNIYSLEELCYVIEHYSYLIEETFFNQELLSWIEQVIGALELAEQLQNGLQEDLSSVELVEMILNATGYLSYEEGRNVLANIHQMQHMTMFERRKMRADRCAENKKYVQALLEYQRVTQMEEECRKDPVVCGNIWHNQGVLYARLFLFKEAKACFVKAYQYHMNIESIYAAMASCKFLNDEEGMRNLAKKYGIDVQEGSKMYDEWKKIDSHQELNEIEQELDKAFLDVSEEKETLKKILDEWKTEYQKNCK